MKSRNGVLLLFTSFLFFSCVTNVEELSVDEEAIPDQVSYSADIQPIFNNSCGGSGCHINNAAFGVNLTDYDRTMNSRGSQYVSEVVITGDADASPLVDKLQPAPRHGSRMPLGGSPLSPTQIQLISDWIDQGAQDN